MNKWLKYSGAFLVAAFVIIQFLGPSRPEVQEKNPDDLENTALIDSEVMSLLRDACYDCHSMETKYPWYANIAPVKWPIYDHIIVGREELNFSKWGTLDKRAKLRKLKDISEEVEELKMPMDGYVKLHPEADLTSDQREMIVTWSKDFAKQVLKK
jgi:hypothetical protein